METTLKRTRKLLISLTHQLYQELMLNIPTHTNTSNLFVTREKNTTNRSIFHSDIFRGKMNEWKNE